VKRDLAIHKGDCVKSAIDKRVCVKSAIDKADRIQGKSYMVSYISLSLG
jgi:hypothetical protein